MEEKIERTRTAFCFINEIIIIIAYQVAYTPCVACCIYRSCSAVIYVLYKSTYSHNLGREIFATNVRSSKNYPSRLVSLRFDTVKQNVKNLMSFLQSTLFCVTKILVFFGLKIDQFFFFFCFLCTLKRFVSFG